MVLGLERLYLCIMLILERSYLCRCVGIRDKLFLSGCVGITEVVPVHVC